MRFGVGVRFVRRLNGRVDSSCSESPGNILARYFNTSSRFSAGGTSDVSTAALPAYIDTHCHLDMVLNSFATDVTSYEQKRKQLYPRGYAIHVCCDPADLPAAAALQKHESLFFSYGVHPSYADKYTPTVEQELSQLMSLEKTVAWGECGLDYFRHTRIDKAIQRSAFIAQMKMAVSHNKPIVLHLRDAESDALQLMQDHLPPTHPIHTHCFTSTPDFASSLLSAFANLYIGFTGVITFAKNLQEVVKVVPIDRLLLETDGPFMAPIPYRGSVSHPGYVPLIAAQVGTIKHLSRDDVLRQTMENAKVCYRLPSSLGASSNTSGQEHGDKKL
eukprot:GILK01004516.1.p1 GENE.GILK01004516.1~~GILK01004516.1.p1  ORF type:complete len:331 (+),score=21.51 GILK01004516.1:72-1064(+)